MKIIFDDGKEIEFDENEVALQDPREQIFKKDGIWYITKIINKDFAKWLDETKPMIIKEKKIPEKIRWHEVNGVGEEDDAFYVDENGNEIEMTLSEMLQNLIETNNRLGKELDDNYKDFKMYHEICDDYNKQVNNLQQRIDKAVEYIKYNATSNYFDEEKNMFRREIDLLEILGGSDKE